MNDRFFYRDTHDEMEDMIEEHQYESDYEADKISVLNNIALSLSAIADELEMIVEYLNQKEQG